MQDGTYIHFRAEGRVGAVLELALMVSCVTDTQASQWRRQISLGGPVVQTEAPPTTKEEREKRLDYLVETQNNIQLQKKKKGKKGELK